MANTAMTLGEQATLDGLVAQTLESFEDDRVTAMAEYALSRNACLQSVNLPRLTAVPNTAFYGDSSLTTVSIPAAKSIGRMSFANCHALQTMDLANTETMTISTDGFNSSTALKHVIIRSTNMSSMSSISSFSKTPIYRGLGAVYVPSDLVDTYKADSNWGQFVIFPISEYPVTDFSTIRDSWSDILAAESNGTYMTKYKVGDTKQITVDGHDILMQIVAFDTDALTGGGTAKITWLAKDAFLNEKINSTATTANGWGATEIRTWLRDTIYPALDSSLKSAIKEVNKTYSNTLTIADTLWIPSAREMFGSASYEDSGCDYTAFFTNNASRLKYDTNYQVCYWWLRSVVDASRFCVVGTAGNVSDTSANSRNCVAIGFCT